MANPTYVLARDYLFSVSTDNVTFTTISGINSFAFAHDNNMQDVRVFADRGAPRDLSTSFTAVVTLEGFMWEDEATGDRDAGQALVDAAVGQLGAAGVRYYKVQSRNVAGDTLVIQANAKFTDFLGGGVDDFAPWAVDLSLYGQPLVASGMWDVIFPNSVA